MVQIIRTVIRRAPGLYPRAYISLCFVWFGSLQRINPCGSVASDGIKLNMMKMEKVEIYRIK